MRRFGRWMFNGLAAISLVLCLAVTSLWIRSQYVSDTYSKLVKATGIIAESKGGWIGIDISPNPKGSGNYSGYEKRSPGILAFRQPMAGEPGVRAFGHAPGFAWFITQGGIASRPSLRGAIFWPHTCLYARDVTLAVIFAIPSAIAFLFYELRRGQRAPLKGRAMRRIGKRLFNAAAVVSLVLCLAIAALWLRSYWVADEYGHFENGWLSVVTSTRGAFLFHGVDLGNGPQRNLGHLGYSQHHPWEENPGLFHQPPGIDPGVISERLFPGVYWRFTNGGRSGKPQTITMPTPSGPRTVTAFPNFTPRRDIRVAHWVVALLFALLPGAALFRRLIRRRPGPGMCVNCGYNLTGNVSGVCPECGKPISNKDTTQA
jgi:hypothetical protein